jgi:hypothetical protein
MPDDALLRRHRDEMVHKKFSIYRIFDEIDRAAPAGETGAVIHREAGGIAEAVISQELSMTPEVEATTLALLRQPSDRVASLFAAWRTALEAAYPSRPAMQLVLTRFGAWLERLPPTVRPCFLELLPKIGPVLKEVGAEGIEELLEAAVAAGSAEACATMLELVGGYGATTGEIVVGAGRVARRALAWSRPDLLERLAAALPADKTLESADAEKLLPALGRLSELCGAQGEACWTPALDLVITFAEGNLSSAYVAARDLPKSLKKLGSSAAPAYLAAFDRLAHAIGLRVVSFGLKELPGLYERYGVERAHAFATTAAEAAETYGATAGQWFLERKTAAARELLGV